MLKNYAFTCTAYHVVSLSPGVEGCRLPRCVIVVRCGEMPLTTLCHCCQVWRDAAYHVVSLLPGVERCHSALHCTFRLSGICWHSSCPSPCCRSTSPTIWASQLADFTPPTAVAKTLPPTATATSTPLSGRLRS